MKLLKHLRIFFLLLCLLLSKNLNAQPAVEWIRTYGDSGRQEIDDVYANEDGTYALCGATSRTEWDAMVIGTNDVGREQWRINIGRRQSMDLAASIIELDGGGWATCGIGQIMEAPDHPESFITRLDRNGEVDWSRIYNEASTCDALIELKEGTLMCAGVSGSLVVNRDHNARLLKASSEDGDPIWDRTYRYRDIFTRFFSVKETDGGVVAAGVWLGDNDGGLIVGKYAINDGREIWVRIFDSDIREDQSSPEIVSVPDGFIINSSGMSEEQNSNGLVCLRKINANGEEQFLRTYRLNQELDGLSKVSGGIVRLPGNNNLVSVGAVRYNVSLSSPLVQLMTLDGDERWYSIYDMPHLGDFRGGINHFFSVALARDGGAVACGVVRRNNDGFGTDGILMKIEPIYDDPIIFFYSPDSTHLECLQGDTIRFIVRAGDQWHRDLDFFWVYDNDTLRIDNQNDTTALVQFNSLGIHTMRCLLSNGEFGADVLWDIKVSELRIVEYSPEQLDTTVRRALPVTFSIDSVASLWPGEVEYRWMMRPDNEGESEIGSERAVTVTSLNSGGYDLMGIAFRGEAADTVEWDVTVRGLIWSFIPEELDLELVEGDRLQFVLAPTTPDTINRFTWSINDSVLEMEIDSSLQTEFPDSGLFRIMAVLTDTLDADTVGWEVTVHPPSGVKNTQEVQPAGSPVLFSVSPNPFNSMVTLRFGLDKSASTRLSIHDIAGREVAWLVDYRSSVNPPWLTARKDADHRGSAEERTVTWDASAFAAGIYFARLEAGTELSTMKMVLVR